MSCVATASYSAVESRTRLRPTSPASIAIANVTSKIRSGRFEARSRARIVTSTRRHEARVVEVHARRVLPPQVECEPVDSLAIAKPFDLLKTQDCRDDLRRDRISADLREQVRERSSGKRAGPRS